MDSILDAEMIWRDFSLDVADIKSAPTHFFRYVRINPNLSKAPPKLDEVDQMDRLGKHARAILETPENAAQLESIAHVLVTSSFCYERTVAV